jgi:DNA-binding protein HU-beta
MFNMNKKELVNVVAEKAELSKKQTGEVVDVVFGEIENALVEGKSLSLAGFGKFEVRERAARKGRNPSTGEEIDIPASKVPAFKAGKVLKEAVK